MPGSDFANMPGYNRKKLVQMPERKEVIENVLRLKAGWILQNRGIKNLT